MLEHAPATPELRLVGRQREVALLWSQFEAAARGRLHVALLAGEPGIGKTRLLEVIAARARQHGTRVLRGGASEAEGMPPYLPFLEALGQHIRTAPLDELREQAGTAASILAGILPELTLRLGELSASYPLPSEQARLRLYEAVGTFLAAVAAPHTLLLMLDDLQWADTASLDLLCHVACHQPDARLLILGAYREGEVEHNAAFQRAIAELTRLRVLTTVNLGPLAAPEVAALATRYLGASIDPSVSQPLYTHSEGNPFFAEELLRGWLETGALARHGERWRLEQSIAATLPPSIVGAIRQRLTRLSPQVVDLLRTAAIIGRTFDVPLLAEVAGQEVETVEERVIEASRVRLIRAGRDGTYTFSHDKIRECLYTDVMPIRRRRLHRFIGRALEARPEPMNAQRLAELAFHFIHSGDGARGASYAQRAAEQAMKAYAFEEAMTDYRAALDLIDPTDERRGDLLLGLGEAAVLAGAEREAVAAFEAAQAWFEQAGDRVAAARAAHGLGRAWWRQEALPAARAALESALALLGDRPCPETVQVLVDLGSLLAVSLHQQTEGLAHAQRALDFAQQLEDDRLVAAASRTVGNLLVRANDLPAGIAVLEQALALAAAVDDPFEAAECCACLAIAYFWNSRFYAMRDTVYRWMEFAERCRDPYQLRHVYTWLATLHSYDGRQAEAEQMFALEQAIVERLPSPEPLAFLHFIRGSLAYQHGEYAAAEQQFTEAIAVFRAMGSAALVWYLGRLGLAQVAQGKVAEAHACIAELEMLLAPFPAGTMPTAEPLSHLTAMALHLGDHERLERYYPHLVRFGGQYHDFLIDRLLGEIETLQGNWAAAAVHLAAAEATARREDLNRMKPELARTLVAQADLELAQGGQGSAARARELLEQAAEIFGRFGNSSDERRLRVRLGSLAEPSATPAHPLLPDGLTRREADVLRLIAAGKSNQEIARELVLSVRTVERHISNIYTKIGATGKVARATATAYALHHDLILSPNT